MVTFISRLRSSWLGEAVAWSQSPVTSSIVHTHCAVALLIILMLWSLETPKQTWGMLPLLRQRFVCNPVLIEDQGEALETRPGLEPNLFLSIEFHLLFHSTPTVQFQETLFPKTERKEEIGVSLRESTTFLLEQISFQFVVLLHCLIRKARQNKTKKTQKRFFVFCFKENLN